MQKEKGRKVFVVGVGMTKVYSYITLLCHLVVGVISIHDTQFEKPGRREDFDYPQMAKESGFSHELCCQNQAP